MFAAIETNGAHTIIIAIPHEGADKSLPALATMLEQNAVFLCSPTWRENALCKPKMTIHLGESFDFQSKDETIRVAHANPNAVISDEWQAATPDVFVSNRKNAESYALKVKQLGDEITFLKLQLEQARTALETVKGEEATA